MRHDPNAFLCETCGYTLSGLSLDGACPECGRSIELSHPARRVGTPWQRASNPKTWVTTGVAMARKPRATWNTIRIDMASASNLTWLNCVASSAGLAILLFSIAAARGFEVSTALFNAVLLILVGTISLVVLSGIEYIGIRLFGRRKGWRVTRDVAATVVAHASYGWLLLPITIPFFWFLAATGFDRALGGSSGLGVVGAALTTIALIAGPGVPLLAFEILVYIGFRRMRYANPPNAA